MLSDRGRSLLESHRRDHDRENRQEFYAELKKPREMEHDAQIYGAYLREAERLQERDARIERVVLDYELKRDYQEWLHERDRGRADADGRSDRDERSRVSKFLSPATVMRCPFGKSPSIVNAASRSAVPVAGVTSASTISPWRFSMSRCPRYASLASLPDVFLNKRASGSVVD